MNAMGMDQIACHVGISQHNKNYNLLVKKGDKFMEYTMKNFLKDKFIIICKEKSETESIMKMFIKEGIKWSGGLSVAYTHCDEYKPECYYLHAGALQCDKLECAENRYEKVPAKDFISANKSNKEKVFSMIDVEVEERFNIKDAACNPFYFDKWFDLRNKEYDEVNYMITSILYENRLEKIPKDIREELKEYIDSLSSEAFYRKDLRKSILLSLGDILSSKSIN